MGGLLTSMLPSQAGIQRAKDIPPGTQGLTAQNPTALNEQATKDSTTTGING